jgi:hypothetical protein
MDIARQHANDGAVSIMVDSVQKKDGWKFESIMGKLLFEAHIYYFLPISAVLSRDKATTHMRADLLLAVPMRYGTATASNMATLVRATYILFGLAATKVVACITDGAASMGAMKRDLAVYSQWCVAHRANIVANVGLSRLSEAPARPTNRSKKVYATDDNEACVTHMNNLCSLLETPSFRHAMKQNLTAGKPAITHFQIVRFALFVIKVTF